MSIAASSLSRLREAKLRPESLITIFEHLHSLLPLLGDTSPELEFKLDYQSEDDLVGEGDMIPVIALRLRPATKYITVQPVNSDQPQTAPESVEA